MIDSEALSYGVKCKGCDQYETACTCPAPACATCGHPAVIECGHCDKPLCSAHSTMMSHDGRMILCTDCAVKEADDRAYYTTRGND
jgi:hypothetical protein